MHASKSINGLHAARLRYLALALFAIRGISSTRAVKRSKLRILLLIGTRLSAVATHTGKQTEWLGSD